MPCAYILYSKILDTFYTGSTHESFLIRLDKHIQSFYKGSFTSQTNDWELFIEIPCNSFSMAVNIERHIKRMKSRVYINNLKKYPEMIDKLKNKFKSS